MKKKLFFVLVLLNSLHTSSCVGNGTDYFELNKKETAKEISIEKINYENQKESTVVQLNENQKKEFINKLKVIKNLGIGKCLFSYKITITYDDKSISFITSGKTIGKSPTGTTYELESNLNLLIHSFFIQDDVFPLYREKIVKVNDRDIRLYQANYSRKNLKFISGLASTETPEQYSCT